MLPYPGVHGGLQGCAEDTNGRGTWRGGEAPGRSDPGEGTWVVWRGKVGGHPDRTCLIPGHLCFCSGQAEPWGPSPDSALPRRLSTGLTSWSLRPCLFGLLGCNCRNLGSLLSLGGWGSASPCQHDKRPISQDLDRDLAVGGKDGPLASLRTP